MMAVTKTTQDLVNSNVDNQVEWDCAIIGAGFRTTTFLASAPELLNYRLTVLERGDVLGPGAFGEYMVTTSSVGSSLFKQLSYGGPFEPLRNNDQVNLIVQSKTPVATQTLGEALREIGSVITESLGGEPAVRLQSNVRKIEVDSPTSPVTLQLEGGEIIRSGHVLIASGRMERPHPDIAKWRDKTLVSGRAISASGRKELVDSLLSLGQRPILIAGCSHSAMSSVQVLLEVTAKLEREHEGYRRPMITLIQRSIAKLMYDSPEQALAEQVEGREQFFDPNRDVCPVTNIVFRDSGLRHGSKQLYCDIWANKLSGIRIFRVSALSEAAELFDGAGLVIQALGYHGEVPDILEAGKLIRPSDSQERLWGDEDGAVVIGGRIFENMSVLRVEPTPSNRKDNSAFGGDLYRRLFERLYRRLSEQQEKRDVYDK